jgi:hypothetical protein
MIYYFSFLLGYLLLPATKYESTPQIFEPGVISKLDAWSFTPAFSQDGNQLMYVRWDNPNYNLGNQSVQVLYQSEKINGKWSEPQKVKQTMGNRVDWPHYSPDGNYFLLAYNKYHARQYNYPNENEWSDFDIWIAPCDSSGNIEWADFAPIEQANINRQKTPENARIRYVHNETSPRMDLQRNLYFWSERLDQGIGRRDIYCAPVKKSKKLSWDRTQLLPKPVNSKYRESGVAISPDGKWLIFSSRRPGGRGKEDLFFTKKLNDSWSKPVNLGLQVNSKEHDYCPQISADGKMLYFTSSRTIPGTKPLDPGEGELVYNAIYSIHINKIKAIQLP